MWRKYFRFKLVPGVMIHYHFGKIDFRSENLDIEMLKQIVQEGSYYLELTPEGQKELLGIELSGDNLDCSVPGVPPRRKKNIASS
jgi:hypothetical protein